MLNIIIFILLLIQYINCSNGNKDVSLLTNNDNSVYICSDLSNCCHAHSNVIINVEQLGFNALAGCVFTSLSFSSNVKLIGEAALMGVTVTRNNVTVPGSIQRIERCAFQWSNIENIVIEEGVTSIGEQAFFSSSLSSLTLPNSLTVVGPSVVSGTNIKCIHSTNYGVVVLQLNFPICPNPDKVSKDGVDCTGLKCTLIIRNYKPNTPTLDYINFAEIEVWYKGSIVQGLSGSMSSVYDGVGFPLSWGLCFDGEHRTTLNMCLTYSSASSGNPSMIYINADNKKFDSIVAYNRPDCCQDGVNGAEIYLLVGQDTATTKVWSANFSNSGRTFSVSQDTYDFHDMVFDFYPKIPAPTTEPTIKPTNKKLTTSRPTARRTPTKKKHYIYKTHSPSRKPTMTHSPNRKPTMTHSPSRKPTRRTLVSK